MKDEVMNNELILSSDTGKTSIPVIRPAIVSFLALTIITGVLYPALVTAVAKVVFNDKANGSIIKYDDHAVGSTLIAQAFTDPKYFWPRPSAANYDGAAGAGSNLGPNNPALAEAVSGRINTLRANGLTGGDVPADLVTASGSGLDPHISPKAAEAQVARVAKTRGVAEKDVRAAVMACTKGRTFGILGEPRVNVLQLNLVLDQPRDAQHAMASPDNELGWRARAFLP